MTQALNRVAFSYYCAKLLNSTSTIGCLAAFDMVKRCPECKVGIATSRHKEGLAVDLILYRVESPVRAVDSLKLTYLTLTEDYATLGKLWEEWGGRWGGTFHDSKGKLKPDGNHFEWAVGMTINYLKELSELHNANQNA